MNRRINTFIILIIIIINSLVATESNLETPRQKRIRILTGTAILSVEYISGYALAYHIWWPEGFRKINALSNIGEKEPFYVDDVIHAIGNAGSQEIHYQLMKHYFHIKSPWPSMLLTSLSWFSIEVLDAMEKRNGWRFSVNDEIGNLLGVAFWYYKYQNPDSPIFLRLGIRQWENAGDYFSDLPLLITDRDKYGKEHNHDKYSILKTELIYKFYNDYYTGVAVSSYSAQSEDDAWGISIGYDVLKKLNRSNPSWTHSPLNFFLNNISMSISFTFWMDKIITLI